MDPLSANGHFSEQGRDVVRPCFRKENRLVSQLVRFFARCIIASLRVSIGIMCTANGRVASSMTISSAEAILIPPIPHLLGCHGALSKAVALSFHLSMRAVAGDAPDNINDNVSECIHS